MEDKEPFTHTIVQDISQFAELSQKVSQLLHAQQGLLGLPTLHGITYVMVRDVIYLKGESAQSSLHMVDGKNYMVNRTLKECEEKLSPLGFCRVHKSYIVSLQHIRRYVKGEGRVIELSDGSRVDITRGYFESLMSKLATL
ncbi:MAG: LytTR family transcriptional regulator [Saprospiraceae bacterium]|nr:LytTR family transcriptional regulator [Candidatus Opimibacter skivensis]